ncbi:SDR family NAD(P)-dependent oxidoreductase [Vibrio genomosp. F10]|uniref:SDR family oxidoreductase n=2 Tax=Vibrio genomosp. F10 TaxID=723171 RepID=A0A1B9QZN8_9VIBR|nr:SDR family NAD(P)-dependent oxidoreductase [Vibrio genomosp. F10]OCH76664.1 SDR family oxidoreductase [Vibrio genomosp. F10]OEE37441.1 short chain dehydrogenase [Vibrio genomosp. F10 str. ZF-129]OEE92921.1 short chain dehydrogenase [Vibrio genomosp. F10 str. 9ZC157]
MNILIIGGSGGIGLALIEHFLSSNNTQTVYATYRNAQPNISAPNLNWHKVDVTAEGDIEELANAIPKLDVLVNAVGVLTGPEHSPEKTINAFDVDFFNQNLSINTVSTLLLARYFGQHLKSKSLSHFVSLSARVGSIEDNQLGGWISYRCSKAALNMAIKTISIEWQRKKHNCCMFAFHPGTTDTSLSKPYQKNVPEHKLFTPQYVAAQLASMIETTTSEDTGKFYSFDGKEIPW